MTPFYGWLLAAALLVGLVGGVGIWRRVPQGGVAARRSLWWAVAVGALALLASGPAWITAPEKGVLLVTPGTNGETLRSVSRRLGSGWRVFDLAPDRDISPFPEAGGPAELAARALDHESGEGPWIVTGWGLPEWDWRRLGRSPAEVIAPGAPEGILSVSWQRRLDLGEDLEIRARVRYPSATTVWLVGPGGAEDSAEVSGGEEEHTLLLRARPRTGGRHVYALREEGEDGRVRERVVEVSVVEPELPALLWIEEAPSFESRRVRDWLAGLGAEVAVRSRISRERFRIDTWNQDDPPPVGRLGESVLERFDLLVLDETSWARLSGTEKDVLENEVADGGLGVLLRITEPARELPWGLALRRLTGDEAETKLVRPVWDSAPGDVTALDDLGARFEPAEGQHAFLTDRRDRPVGVWRERGRGRVAALAVPETHVWALEGRSELHGGLWSHVLSLVSRPLAADLWVLPAGPVLLDDPLEALVITRSAEPAIELQTPEGISMRLAPRQDSLVPSHWRVIFHPRDRGWHRLASPAGEISFYAEDPRRWRDWDRARRLDATRAAALTADEVVPAGSRLPLRLLLWLAAIGSLGLLWGEERWGVGRR